MRYRGGAVGHKTIRNETKCLLDDRDKLDKIPFVLESEREQEFHRGSEDVEMDRGDIDDGEDEDEDGDGDENENNDEMEAYSTDDGEVRGESTDGTDSGAEDVEDDESDQGEDDETGSNDDMDMIIDPGSISTLLADDELLDEMDEFGYSGLDQVVEDEGHEEDDDLADDALGAEDGENEGSGEDIAQGYL